MGSLLNVNRMLVRLESKRDSMDIAIPDGWYTINSYCTLQSIETKELITIGFSLYNSLLPARLQKKEPRHERVFNFDRTEYKRITESHKRKAIKWGSLDADNQTHLN